MSKHGVENIFKNLQYILAKVILFGRYHLNIKEVLPPRPNRDKPITFFFSFIPDIGDRSVFVNWGGPEKFKEGGDVTRNWVGKREGLFT